MSYDIEVLNPEGQVVQLPRKHSLTGGTYEEGGSHSAELNVTYNYSPIYRQYGFSIRDLGGLSPGDASERLRAVIAAMPEEPPCDNYWRATVGNARKALVDLAALIELTGLTATWRIKVS